MNPIDKAIKDKSELAVAYGVQVSEIVWIGDNKYIICKENEQIRI